MLARLAALASMGMLVYACTLDFGEYRGDAPATTTTTGGAGGTTTAGGMGGTTTTGGTGGTTASGGGTAGGGTAGSGGSPVGCPSAEPSNQMSCSDAGLICTYADRHCHCWRGEWECDDCPATEPTNGENCDAFDNNDRCFYAPTQCRCDGGPGPDEWECGQCPVDPVDNGDCSGLSGLHCSGANGDCTCFFNNWSCQ